MQKIAEFGERILWYTPRRDRSKLAPRWRNGVFVGRAFDSDQNFSLLLDGSIARARAMHRVTPEIRWDASRVQRVAGTPLALTLVTSEPIEELHEPHRGPDVPPQDGPHVDDVEPHFRRMPILEGDLQAHGFTDGCPNCECHRQ